MIDTTTIDTWVNAIYKLSPVPFTVFSTLLLGYFFRAIPQFPNRWLWMVCGVSGTILFPILAHRHPDDTEAVFIARALIIGLFIGLGSWGFHDKILSQVEDKIPLLKQVVAFIDNENKPKPTDNPAPTTPTP